MNTTKDSREQMWISFRGLLAVQAGVLLLCLAVANGRAQTYTVLHSFTGDDGEDPWAGLALSGATLYGAAEGGGNMNRGTVFKINIDGSGYTVLHSFGAVADDGWGPMGELVLSADRLYGTTYAGGGNNAGTVFKINIDGTGFAVLHTFGATPNDGLSPQGMLALSGTSLYGTTRGGGNATPDGQGTVYKLNTDGSGYETLHSFGQSTGVGDGPEGGVVLSGTTLYGTTSGWSSVGQGSTVFKLDTDGTGFTVLAKVGYMPMAPPLISGTTLYGTTVLGENGSSVGTLFKVGTDGVGYKKLVDLYGPYGSLVLAGTNLYGTTVWTGGVGRGFGTIFRVNTNGADVLVLKECGSSDGEPLATLLMSGTTLYGTARYGGAFGKGVIFSFSLPVAATILVPPQTQSAELGGTVDFAVDAVGEPPPAYQWFFNGTNDMGCTKSSLELTHVQFSQSGTYAVVATNTYGSATSSPVMLNVIASVDRRMVPALSLTGDAGSLLNVDYASGLNLATDWSTLDSVSLASTSQFYFDLTAPLPPQRFYRVWQPALASVVPSLTLNMIPAITLTGNVGDSLELDCINQFGPTNAWVTLDTITLTHTSQLYFDTSMIGQPPRLYRIVPVP